MSQTNTNTNTNNDQNVNQNSGRRGRGQGLSGRGRGSCHNNRKNNSIKTYAFEGKIKDGPISKLIITKTGHQPTQYKKIVGTLLVLCVDKNYQGLDEVVRARNDLVEADFMPLCPDAIQWSATHHVQISTVNPMDIPQAYGSCPARLETLEQTHIFDTNLMKELLFEYERDSKIKSQEYTKFLADKKALTTIIFGQCDEETRTKNYSWSYLYSGLPSRKTH